MYQIIRLEVLPLLSLPSLPRRAGPEICNSCSHKIFAAANIIYHVMELYRLSKRCYFDFFVVLPHLFHITSHLSRITSSFCDSFHTFCCITSPFCFYFQSFNRITSPFCDTRELVMWENVLISAYCK